MIKNEKQYRISVKRKFDFEKAKQSISSNSSMDPILKDINLRALKAQLEILESEIEEYISLKSQKIHQFIVCDLAQFPEVLVKARISRGWTQKDLANEIKLKEQQIQKYESNNYENAGWTKIVQIADKLGIRFNKFKGSVPVNSFLLPKDVSAEQISLAQDRVREKKSLFYS